MEFKIGSTYKCVKELDTFHLNELYKCYDIFTMGSVQYACLEDKNKHTYQVTLNCVKYFEEIQSKENKVEHPSHYTWLKDKCGIEVIDIVRHLDFCTGNAIKYLLRAGHKEENGYTNKEKTIEDLKKAIFYINDYIKTIENGD